MAGSRRARRIREWNRGRDSHLVSDLEAWVETAGGSYAMTSQRFAPDVLHPDGATRIVSFTTEPWPTWQLALPDGTEIERSLRMGS